MVTNLLDKTELSKKILYFCRIKRLIRKKLNKLHYFGRFYFSSLSAGKVYLSVPLYPASPLCGGSGRGRALFVDKGRCRRNCGKGKMFGVLIVRTGEGEVGYLAAFSGILAGKNRHTYFVPPVYDVQEPDGFLESKKNRYRESTGGI